MEKLDTPVSIDTAVGPVQCSLVAHNYTVNEIGDRRIVSTRQYCVQVGKELRPVGQASSRDFTGEERDSLGDDPTGSAILAFHKQREDEDAQQRSTELGQRAQELQKQIEDTERQLAALKAAK